MTETVIGQYYQQIAKDLTAFLFDKGFLADDLAMESIKHLNEYLGFLFQSYCESSVKAAMLSKKIKGGRVPRKEK